MIGAFLGGNPPDVPAGKAGISLSVNTTDRQNLDTASWTLTGGGKTYTVNADASGRAYIEVDAGITYTVTLTHQGNYENDGPQTVITESTMQYGVLFDLFSYAAVSTVVIVQTGENMVVTATDGETTYTEVSNASGIATFNGLPANTEWTFTIPEGITKTVVISTLVTQVNLEPTYIYGVRIARSTSSPTSRCVYIDDCASFTPASGTALNSWAGNRLISGIRPVVFNGKTFTDLNKRDLTKTIDGSASNIGTAGNDAMTVVPTWWLSITNDSSYIYIRFSNRQIDSSYHRYASMFDGEDVGQFAVGCFLGYVTSSKLYSKTGNTPTVNTTITDFITYAHNRGTGYDLFMGHHVIYLQALFTLLYRSTNCQTALGQGYVAGSAIQSNTALSFSNDYGMAGSTSTTARMSFFWIHDFWGNIYQFIGGMKTNSSRQLMTIVDGLASITESDFTLQSTSALSSDLSGSISDVVGTSEAGFFPQACSGSATTYWCDGGIVRASLFSNFGGDHYRSDQAGCFNLVFSYSATGTSSYLGSRLSYRVGGA